MKKNARRDEFNRLLFGLTDSSVVFRSQWRTIVLIAVWLILSGITMLATTSVVEERMHIGILISLSLIKFAPFLLIVYNFSRKMSARYLDDIYELNNEELASDFLEQVTFGYGHEKITINEGRITDKDERSSMILIGGPGKIQVNLDSVALLETVDGEPKVIFPRNEAWKLGRFERIREIGKLDEAGKREYAIINLRDQFVSGLAVRSRTKDGIPLEAHGIKVMFSVLRNQDTKSDMVQGDSFSFDENAIRALVYNQTIITPEPSASSGVSFPWDTTVIPLVLSELENLITSHTLSEILASISQQEVDNLSQNDKNNAKMRVEMTGQHISLNGLRESLAPNFESRSKITASFFHKSFREKAAQIGVSIHWIDIGNWQFPNTLIQEKHKEAWNLSRENAKLSGRIKQLAKRSETKEIIALINQVFNAYFETNKTVEYSSKNNKEENESEVESSVSFEDAKKDFYEKEEKKKHPSTLTKEILRAFRKELNAGKTLIENDNRPMDDKEKQQELAAINNALMNISAIAPHYVGNP